MLGCLLTAILVLVAMIILFIVCAAPLVILVGLGIALIWLLIWLLFHHTVIGIILLVVIILMEFIWWYNKNVSWKTDSHNKLLTFYFSCTFLRLFLDLSIARVFFVIIISNTCSRKRIKYDWLWQIS